MNSTANDQDISLAWVRLAFGDEVAISVTERAMRFLEESLELVQATDRIDRQQAHAMVDYVYDRKMGELRQEVGGVGVTLYALCSVLGIDFGKALHDEQIRAMMKTEKIRAKHAQKPAEIKAAA